MKSRWAKAGALLTSTLIAVIAVILGAGWTLTSTPHPNPCVGTETLVAGGFVELVDADSASLTLTALGADDPLVVSFGDADGTRSDVVVLAPVPASAILHRTKPSAPVAVRSVTFRAAIDGALTAPGRASINASPTSGFHIHTKVTDGGDLVVCLEVDRTQLIEARQYTGKLNVSVKGRKLAVVPVSVESRAPREDAAWPAIAGFIGGLLIKLIAEGAAGARQKQRSAARRYATSWAFTLDVAFGAIAVGALIRVLYLQDSTFGDSGDDPFALAAAAAAAQLGASGLVDLGKRITTGRDVVDDQSLDDRSKTT